MAKKLIPLIVFAFVLNSCETQSGKISVVVKFIEELKKGTGNDVLVKTYLDEDYYAMSEFVEARLNNLRYEIRHIDSIRVSGYDSRLIEKLVVPDEEKENVFFASSENLVFPFLIHDDKISAFSILRKDSKPMLGLLQ